MLLTPSLQEAVDHVNISPHDHLLQGGGHGQSVFIGVSFFFWFVNYQVYAKSTEPIFHKIRWKGGTWATGKTIDFGVNPDHVTLGLGLYGVLPNSA